MVRMTRIIAGEHGGRRLRVPDAGTRPTSDRVRESLFNVLTARTDLTGDRVLDLYAGSGALGLEALSRGAASATFVDNRRQATRVVTGNLRDLGLVGRGRVVTGAVSAFLATAPSSDERIDLVFSDPPYALGAPEVDDDLRRLAAGWLAPDALVVVERGVRGDAVTWPDVYEQVLSRTYGDTRVDVGRFTP